MGLREGLIAELKHEATATQKILENVPMESIAWKPHEKSMTLGRLATHIAQMPSWVSNILQIDDYDFATQKQAGGPAATKEELLQIFTTIKDKAIADLETASDEEFDKMWIVRSNGQIVYQLPKKVALRAWGYSHLYHHRGQLSVYLRLLNIPVPGMYGPSADESM